MNAPISLVSMVMLLHVACSIAPYSAAALLPAMPRNSAAKVPGKLPHLAAAPLNLHPAASHFSVGQVGPRISAVRMLRIVATRVPRVLLPHAAAVLLLTFLELYALLLHCARRHYKALRPRCLESCRIRPLLI